MYKIYINDHPLYILNQAEPDPFQTQGKEHMTHPFPDKKKFLANYIDMLEKSTFERSISLLAKDVEAAFQFFAEQFKIVEAAGGRVEHTDGTTLLIYRRKMWDLPKGKIDPGESRAEAAVREVEEETGLTNLTLHAPLITTYHTYRQKKKRILKPTYWYHMTTTQRDIEVQTEEDIEEGIWIDREEFLASDRPVFGNIRDVLLA